MHKLGKPGYRRAAPSHSDISMDGVSHNDTVRGKVIIISTLTPSLSRQRERGVAIFFPPKVTLWSKVALTKGSPSV